MALTNPKTKIKLKKKDCDSNPKIALAMEGKMDRSMPKTPPTQAFTRSNKLNCLQFFLKPNTEVACFMANPSYISQFDKMNP